MSSLVSTSASGSMASLVRRLKTSDLTLRPHQNEGIEKILEWINNGHGGILADEMGLGKTCQIICALVLLAEQNPKSKFVVISPLSVIAHWENELIRFGCNALKVFVYKGLKDVRLKMRPRLSADNWNVCLTTYDYFRRDAYYFPSDLHGIIVDEAHVVKSDTGLLHQCVRERHARFCLLLTGTPVQNNVDEFYSLLSLVAQDEFKHSKTSKAEFFSQPRNVLDSKLRSATERFLLRRLKADVCKEIPPCEEIVILHGLTKSQRDLYNAVLVTNHAYFDKIEGQRQSLMNILVQLRKATAHPYLFKGVEPQPFVEGEHLFLASGKFILIDKLLAFLINHNHRCLIFSPYARHLEILADALSFRGYNYEHLTGQTKSEDRFRAIDNFQNPQSNTYIFLMSTKAGGQGLNLTAADTIIFLDSDVNPHNDLQAAARCHRIGQTKPVRVIRLLAEFTVDTAIRARGNEKMKLSSYLLEDNEAQLSLNSLRDVILSDLVELNRASECTENYGTVLSDDYFECKIGKTDENGHWVIDAGCQDTTEVVEDKEIDLFPTAKPIFSTKKLSAEDEALFNKLKAALLDTKNANDADEVVAMKHVRKISVNTANTGTINATKRKREERRESLAKRRKLADEKAQEARNQLWASQGYTSRRLTQLCAALPTAAATLPANGRLFRVFGSVGSPVRARTDAAEHAWIVHAVDTGGRWGQGGLFSVLTALSPSIADTYETAARMQDLHVGDVHFVDAVGRQQDCAGCDYRPEVDLDEHNAKTAVDTVSRTLNVALLVAQSLRDRYRNYVSESTLKRCFTQLAEFAHRQQTLPSVHMAMLWWGRPNLSEQTVCNLILKCLCRRGVDVYVYHYRRGGNRARGSAPAQQQPQQLAFWKKKSAPQTLSPPAKRKRTQSGADNDEDSFVTGDDDEEEEEEMETDSELESEAEFTSDDDEDSCEDEEEEDESLLSDEESSES